MLRHAVGIWLLQVKKVDLLRHCQSGTHHSKQRTYPVVVLQTGELGKNIGLLLVVEVSSFDEGVDLLLSWS